MVRILYGQKTRENNYFLNNNDKYFVFFEINLVTANVIFHCIINVGSISVFLNTSP